jgi:hypothetical protein
VVVAAVVVVGMVGISSRRRRIERHYL